MKEVFAFCGHKLIRSAGKRSQTGAVTVLQRFSGAYHRPREGSGEGGGGLAGAQATQQKGRTLWFPDELRVHIERFCRGSARPSGGCSHTTGEAVDVAARAGFPGLPRHGSVGRDLYQPPVGPGGLAWNHATMPGMCCSKSPG
jgi:hypothetical protein